ncbi:hypothetical protein OAV88_04260, partial [bacterium]|nr:hypothetical protein [bacterium]
MFVKKKVKITIERLNRLFCVLSCRRRNKEGKRFVVALERPKRKKKESDVTRWTEMGLTHSNQSVVNVDLKV